MSPHVFYGYLSQAFPGIRKMEAEVVQMTVDMLHGDENACGTVCRSLACCASNDSQVLAQTI